MHCDAREKQANPIHFKLVHTIKHFTKVQHTIRIQVHRKIPFSLTFV